METQSLQRHLYKTRTMIQNVKPNKTTGSAENMGSPAWASPDGCSIFRSLSREHTHAHHTITTFEITYAPYLGPNWKYTAPIIASVSTSDAGGGRMATI